jgi:hypothetical protein
MQVDHKIELMEQAQKSAVGPEMLPNEILRSIGCCALRDLGGMAWVSASKSNSRLCILSSLALILEVSYLVPRALALARSSSHTTSSRSYLRWQHPS